MSAASAADRGPAPLDHADARRRMAVLWLVVFVDLLGFGVLIPLVPFYGLRLGLSADWVTLIIALHSLFQFIGAPFLGRLSDRYGRRPVLAISMAGHALAYGMLALPGGIVLLVLSRMLSGLTSGNLAAAYAYVTDISHPAERARGFARVSSAFALGFALGPAVGGLLAGSASPDAANLLRPALAAALLSLLALVGILMLLPESRRAHERTATAHAAQTATGGRLAPLRDVALLSLMLLSIVVYTFASMRESILAIWLHGRFALATPGITLAFTVNGLTVAVMQFFAAGWIVQRLGEFGALRTGILCYGLSWLALALAPSTVYVFPAVALGAVGTALFGTSAQTLAAQRAAPAMRGAVMGLLQSSASLARFGGAALAGTLYTRLGANIPFESGAAAMIPALWLAIIAQRRLRQPPPRC